MEASNTPPEEGTKTEQPANEGGSSEGGPAAANEVAIEGDQGEQVSAATGMVPDGEGGVAFRQSAPPPDAQSGVPIESDRQAGVEPGEPGPQGGSASGQSPVGPEGGQPA